MKVVFTNESGTYALYTWHKVQALDGVCPETLYIRIMHAWDNDGNKLYELTKGAAGTMELEVSTTKTP